MTIPTPAPTSTTLFLDPEEWDHLSARLADPYFEKLHQRNEQAVAVMLEAGKENIWSLPTDLRAPDQVRTDDERWRILKHRLLRFTLSWRLTAREDCLREALRTVDALLEPRLQQAHYTAAGLRHADLKTADLWFDAVFAKEALWPALDDARKVGLQQFLLEWGLPAYLRGWADYDWWRHAEFNWGASVHGCAGLAALAVQEVAPELSREVLQNVREGLDFVLEALPLGGGWIEGMMYQVTTLGHLTDFIAAYHRMTGDDYGLGQERRLRDGLDFRMRMVGDDDRPINFSNCNEQACEWSFPHGYWWANHCDRPEWAGFEDAYQKPWWDTHGVFLDIEAFWMRKPYQPAEPYHRPSGFWHARDIDWLTWRRGESWFAFRSGWNGGNHCNLDLGQIIFGHGDERILADPGYGAAATNQHSCVILRGKSQLHDTRTRIFRTREWKVGNDYLFYLCCDLSATYPASLAYHYRHCLMSERGWLFVLDDLLVKQGLRAGATGHLQTRLEPMLETDSFRLAGSVKGVHGRFLTPVRSVQVEAWEWGNLPVYALKYRPEPDRPHARMGWLLSQQETAEATFEAHGDHAVFRYDQVEVRFDLSEGSAIPVLHHHPRPAPPERR